MRLPLVDSRWRIQRWPFGHGPVLPLTTLWCYSGSDMENLSMLVEAKTTACGALFIAFGEQYRREVVPSVRSIRKFHPDLACCVISERKPDDLPYRRRSLGAGTRDETPIACKAPIPP